MREVTSSYNPTTDTVTMTVRYAHVSDPDAQPRYQLLTKPGLCDVIARSASDPLVWDTYLANLRPEKAQQIADALNAQDQEARNSVKDQAPAPEPDNSSGTDDD